VTEVNEQPTPEPEPDPDVIDELADDDAPADMRAVRRMRAENKKLRHRLRESEANRATAEEGRASDLARLAALEKREIEREASALLADPQDIWRTDEATQQEFVDQQFGEVIPDAVRDAARLLIESKPHLARRATPPPSDRPVEGLRSGAAPETKPKPTSWAAAIRGH
jgi:hypothetical protein